MKDLVNQVITETQYRGYSSNTTQAYSSYLTRITKFFGRSLDEVCCEELNTYFQQPSVRRLSYASISLQINSLAFLYKHILKQPLKLDVVKPQHKKQPPDYLSRNEVALLIKHCRTLRMKTMTMLCQSNDIQFIWAVFSAFSIGTRFEVKEPPYIYDNPDYWNGSNPGEQIKEALFEIGCWDSSATILVGITPELANNFKSAYSDTTELKHAAR